MLKVYNSETLKENLDKPLDRKVMVPVFAGNARANLDGNADQLQYMEVSPEVANADINELAYRVRNAADAPSEADITAFWGKYFYDLTRPTVTQSDITGLIANEFTDFNLPRTVDVRDVIPYIGKMGVISGVNDAVNLIQQNEGNLDTFKMELAAVGWKDNINNMLYNRFFQMDKVVRAAQNADIDYRNNLAAGTILGTTYAASQKQAAASTSGSSFDELTYETMQKGIKTLRGLKDIYTSKKISVPRISVLCNSADTWQIENVIRGQLNMGGSAPRGIVAPGLPISSIIEYDGGITDGQLYGKETIAYPGVTAGKCYLFVPGVMLIGNKRPFTMEAGKGSVLELSTEERAWYRVMGGFMKQFLGTSFVGSTCGTGYGYVVEVTLPA